MIKKIIILSTVIFLLSAAGIRNLYATRLFQERGVYGNKSAEYVRTLNRFASTDADGAFYNPAGLVFMDNKGLYISATSQTYYVKKTHTLDYYAIKYGAAGYVQTWHKRPDFTGGLPEEYNAELTAPSLPDLFIVYNGVTSGHEWAIYFHAGVMQAATGMYFPDGLAVMDWGNLAYKETLLAQTPTDIFNSFSSDAEATRTEYFIGGTVGGSYKIAKWVSIAAGARYIYYMGNMNLQVDDVAYVVNNAAEKNPDHQWNIDTDYKGHGAAAILGFHFRPFKMLDIGLKVEYFTPVELVKTTSHFKSNSVIEASGNLDIFKDGSPSPDGQAYGNGSGSETISFQYPMSFSLGLSYRITGSLRVEGGGEIKLNRFRDLDGEEKDYESIGWKAGGCIEWWFLENAAVSAGYLYNDFGIKDSRRDEADMLLTSHTVAFGFGFMINKRFDVNIGAYYEIYIPETLYTSEFTNPSGTDTYHALKKEFKETRFSVAIGFTYRFMGSSSSSSSTKKYGMSLNR